MRFCPIASGSSGNCIYIGSDTTHLLVDAGISGKKTYEGLATLDLTMDNIDGILITHEHSDHIKGLGVLARRFGVPIYATPRTRDYIISSGDVGEIPSELFVDVSPDNKFMIKDISVNPIHISHDAADPVGYRFSYGTTKAAVVTDLGCYNDYIVNSLIGLDVLMLEANHDINMLQVGPYPYYLKKRILSDHGHLSNEAAGQLLSKILHDDIKQIYLGHLSKENNIPELAYEAVKMEVTVSETPYNGGDFNINVAKRSEPSVCIEF